ncbi:MAG: hypothetical protein GXY58_19395 [Planctomycetaceae bacterium]|nr:hypothetical protein [Planctomycetaceae bacterium]
MSLADMDRPTVTWHYDRWDADIVFRPISARQLATLSGEFGNLHGESVDTPEALRFYAAVLAASVVSHEATADEWLDISVDTLKTVGRRALEINGLLVEETEKN